MTMKRMFKEMLTTSRYMKVISIITVASMLLTLTACGGTASQQDAVVTTESNSKMTQQPGAPEEPNQDIDDGADISEPTEDPNPSTGEPSSTEESPSDNDTTENPPTGGAYTYTVYGQTISMDVNVDDYISSGDSGKVFKLARMAYDLGWVGNDIYTAVDSNDYLSYSSEWYAHHDGDITTRIDLGYYNEEQIPGKDSGQFRTVNVRFLTNSNSNYYASGDSDILHRNLTCDFGKHYSDCEYMISGTGWYASYEDIVMITYMFWSAAENTGNNPLVPVFGTDSGTFGASVDSSTISYSFP